MTVPASVSTVSAANGFTVNRRLDTPDVWWVKETIRISRIANESLLQYLTGSALQELSRAVDRLTWLIASEVMRRSDDDGTWLADSR